MNTRTEPNSRSAVYLTPIKTPEELEKIEKEANGYFDSKIQDLFDKYIIAEEQFNKAVAGRSTPLSPSATHQTVVQSIHNVESILSGISNLSNSYYESNNILFNGSKRVKLELNNLNKRIYMLREKCVSLNSQHMRLRGLSENNYEEDYNSTKTNYYSKLF